MKPRNLVIIFILLQLGVALLTDSGTFTHEESMWHYIGRNWFRFGMTPYNGGIDNKSPLIFAVFGLSDFLFGINYWFPRVAGALMEAAGLYFLYKIALKITADNKTAVIAATVYGLSVLWRITGGKYVSFTETYAVTLMIMAVYYYLNAEKNKNIFFAGMLAGFAIGWRISAVFSVLAIGEHALFKKRRALLAFFAGVASCILILLIIASITGIKLPDTWMYLVSENFGRGSTTDHSSSWKTDSFLNIFVYSEMLLFSPLLAIYFLSGKRHSLLTIWLVCEFIGIAMLGIYAYPHLKALLPPLSLISGIAIAQLMHHYNFPFNKVLIAVFIIFFPKTVEPLIAIKKMVSKTKVMQDNCMPPYPRPSDQKEKQLGLWIKSNTIASDKVLVAGFGARVQLYSGRLSPSVYFNVTQTRAAIDRFKNEVINNKPKIIAVPVFKDYEKYVNAELRGFIDSLVKSNYSHIQCINGYSIYKQ